MGVDSRAAAACHGSRALRETLAKLLVRPGQRPGPALSRASAARARQCSLPWSRYTRTAFFGGRPPTARPQAAESRSTIGPASQDRCGQSGFCKCDPFPFFFSSDATEILTLSPSLFCPLCALPIASLVITRDRAVPTHRRRDAVGTPTHIASRIWASGANGAHELQPFAAVNEGGAESAKLHINHHSRIQPGPMSTCSCSTAEHLRTPSRRSLTQPRGRLRMCLSVSSLQAGHRSRPT